MQGRSIFISSLFITLVCSAGLAQSADERIIAGQRLAANCASCHGMTGQAQGNALPSLAGQPQADLVLKMKEYKAGTRAATIMHQLAKGYTDEQIELIAAYFAAQKK